jgi:hypothetical protein
MDPRTDIDTRPGFYYVSVIRDDGAYRFLAGPFETHVEALAAVPRARDVARDLDPRATWYAFGTARTDENSGPGMLNNQLAEN